MRSFIVATLLSQIAVVTATPAQARQVLIETNCGDIIIDLYEDPNLPNEPTTAVANFLNYINDDDYVDSLFHFSGFTGLSGGGAGSIIWGGRYRFDSIDPNGTSIIGSVPKDPVVSDPAQTLRPNKKYTITMAQNGLLEYSSEFFINMSDNPSLDTESFTVFGEITDPNSQAVLDLILAKPTTSILASVLSDLQASAAPYDDVDMSGDVQVLEFVRILDTSVMPEPTSLGLVALGGLAVARRRRRHA